MNRTVKDWRDEVSEFMGYTRGKLEEMHADIRSTNGCVKKNTKRIGELEVKDKARDAQQKTVKTLLSGLWAAIGGAVVWLLQKFVRF